MPFLDLDQHRLSCRLDGVGADKPWLIFCNSLGTDLHMWDGQIEALADDLRILRYDCRGHGLSSAPPSPFKLSELAEDVIALMDHLAIEKAHFCGLSIGGLVGQWLAIHAGHRFDKFVFCATAARLGNRESWQERIDAVNYNGLSFLVAGTAERWFTPKFRSAAPEGVRKFMATFEQTTVDGYLGCCAALRDADLRSDLPRIYHPVLAISGKDDPVCVASDLELIAVSVSRGRHLALPGRHIVNFEAAGLFNAALAEFLAT
ncbi:3-oxoadipate enol-lactonase [Rhizobium sp. RU33A]|uniref:3-oxoadipate enol-lactonase n=1 Tax=Rhizobium sp. RU33A TaxID=1907413 RepID=UPI0009552082|nr:3-oxoadipate enol-lactonase [Rhizobium sp. RU33A]SIQ85254.1 3-oxoadipate enol-lactonase [Rhizobium sp. RU33A]